MIREQGYTKFKCEFKNSKVIFAADVVDLIHWRDVCRSLGVVGVYEDGIGFGNLSLRLGDKAQFVITGTQTGHLSTLNEDNFSRVVRYSVADNSLSCEGGVPASSESLTHAVIYECSPKIKAIIHFHDHPLWLKLKGHVPTTPENVEAGTVDMAEAIRSAVGNCLEQGSRIVAMAGHLDGLVVFGETLKVAGETVLTLKRDIKDS